MSKYYYEVKECDSIHGLQNGNYINSKALLLKLQSLNDDSKYGFTTEAVRMQKRTFQLLLLQLIIGYC